jgi:pyridoxamine 5'-phosphate oxidase
MTLATVGADGCPSARIVLLKGIENEAFTFFTNYNSKKGQDINGNSNVALVFNWLDLQRQVRIKGVAEKVSAAASTAYFQSRPKGSQIGAWVSAQSEVIAGRVALEERYKELEEQFKMETVLPRPEHWGGYAVYPEEVEFWQGRSSRLHDRIRYTKQGNDWIKERLAP